ncbi:MAG: spore germination protein [Intestinimonas sp.]|jgi:spore germination protein KA|nr:spore germination protein [Intestinimonas sp.]
MFRFIYGKFRFWKALRKNEAPESGRDDEQEEDGSEFSNDIQVNLSALKGIIANSNDVVCRRFSYGEEPVRQAAVLYIDGLADKELVNENIMKPLMGNIRSLCEDGEVKKGGIEYVESVLLFASSVKRTASVGEALDGFLSGDTVLLIDGSAEALVVSLRGWKSRGIEEPQTESVVRGPREGFTETLRFNTAMLRRKIKDPDLVFESMKIGARTKTDVCIAYIKDIASPDLIKELRQRLKRIKTDAILESGYIEQFIEDAPFSIFSTVANSEKPDKVAAKLLEGRAAIFVDGTPFVLTVPMIFFESFQSAEDYYSRPFFASMVRLVRFLAFFISILAPALYVALTTFHQEMIPTPLLLTMAAAHEGVPFPAVLEAGLMIVAFEILREAGVRLARPIGQAVSIVGALVIGEAAVSAGLIGAPMVIVVAVTAVSSFVVPSQTDSGAIMRFILLILAGVMGGFGIAMGMLAVLVHMASLRSFGTPYLSSLAPFNKDDMKDIFIRGPLWAMTRRPKDIWTEDEVRQGPDLKPEPPQKNNAAQE